LKLTPKTQVYITTVFVSSFSEFPPTDYQHVTLSLPVHYTQVSVNCYQLFRQNAQLDK